MNTVIATLRPVQRCFLVLVCAGCLAACSTTEIIASEDAATATNVCTDCHKTTWAFAWGLVEPVPIDPKCRTGKMTKARVKDNLGYALLTVATLGIVMPQCVEWVCAPDDRPIGDIEDPE